MTDNTKDVRRFLRIPKSLLVQYKLLNTSLFKEFNTADISQGGVRFFVKGQVLENALLIISIRLEKIAYPLNAMVRVKWVKKVLDNNYCEVGAEFINLPPESFAELNRYLENANINKEG